MPDFPHAEKWGVQSFTVDYLLTFDRWSWLRDQPMTWSSKDLSIELISHDWILPIDKNGDQIVKSFLTWTLRSNSRSRYISHTLTFAVLSPIPSPAVLSPIQRNGAPRLSYWADPSIGSRNILPAQHCVSLDLHPKTLYTSNICLSIGSCNILPAQRSAPACH